MTVTSPLLKSSADDEEEDDDVSKVQIKETDLKYKSQIKCFEFTKFTLDKVKGYFSDRKKIFDVQYLLRNRKYVLLFMALLFTICYLNAGDWSDNDRITVIHHSHVPGMKGKPTNFQKIEFLRIVGVLFHYLSTFPKWLVL